MKKTSRMPADQANDCHTQWCVGVPARSERTALIVILIDRFRSLPMARSAVLAGRTLADLSLAPV